MSLLFVIIIYTVWDISVFCCKQIISNDFIFWREIIIELIIKSKFIIYIYTSINIINDGSYIIRLSCKILLYFTVDTYANLIGQYRKLNFLYIFYKFYKIIYIWYLLWYIITKHIIKNIFLNTNLFVVYFSHILRIMTLNNF